MSYDTGYSSGYTRIGFPRPTPAIARLMIVNVAVFVANMVLGGRLGEWLALSWAGIQEGYGFGLLRLFSYQFVHSFDDPMHLLYNMVALYFFGGIAERGVLGYLGTLKVYLVGGLVGGLAHMGLYGLMLGRSVDVVGASGSCYALLIYAVCTKPRLEVWCLFFNFQLIFLGLLMVALGLYQTYVEILKGVSLGVSHGAHLGGALLGFGAWRAGWFRDFSDAESVDLFGALGRKVRAWKARRQATTAAADQQELDRILEKIQKQGMPSLSANERRVLARASDRAKRK